MIATPAIDLRDGACVQLVGGSYDHERIRIPDVADTARRWAADGFTRLHVVDLDAAMAVGQNDAIVDGLLSSSSVHVSVGGGVRTTERVTHLIDSGAQRVVLGTRALENPEWLEEIATRFKDRVVVAADVRERRVVTRGWVRELPLDITELVARVAHLPLSAVLVTAVHREGQMRGPDLELIEDVVRESSHPVIAAGGIGCVNDLRALQSCGAAECVIGMALYSGALDGRAVAAEFCE